MQGTVNIPILTDDMERPVDGGRSISVNAHTGIEAHVVGGELGDSEGVVGGGAGDVPIVGDWGAILGERR